MSVLQLAAAFFAGFLLADLPWKVLMHFTMKRVHEQRALINEQGDLIDQMKPYVMDTKDKP